MILIADTGALLAATDRANDLHEEFRKELQRAGMIVVPPTFLVEVDHLVRRAVKNRLGGQAPAQVRRRAAQESRAVLAWILDEVARTRMVLPVIDEPLLRTAASVMARYADLALDLADAVIVALAADYGTNCLLTVDQRDFRTIRPLSRHAAFQLLPFDR